MASESDKREFTRVPLTFHVQLTVAEKPLTDCLIRDLSMKGMLVLTKERFPLGSPVEAVLSLVDGEVEIHTSGTIAADHPEGFGVEFSTIDGLESYMHLRNLVLFNSQDVEKMEEEFQAHAGIRRRE